MNRFKIALIIAGVATVLDVVGLIINQLFAGRGEAVLAIGVVIGLISYLFAGLFTALRMAKKIGGLGFIFAPFPVSIITGLMTIALAFIALLFIPILPIFRAYRENMI